MPVKRTHLGEAELEIMQILWSAREPRTASQILAQLQGRRTWALSTLMTALARLGIMEGTSATTLSPLANTTVEQGVLLVLRAYETL